jgi:type I restriction enzyme R subunit
MMRPIFSPSDFIQMKGRGTRKHAFMLDGRKEEKANFKLFDFFGNCDYFEEGFDYDEELLSYYKDDCLLKNLL